VASLTRTSPITERIAARAASAPDAVAVMDPRGNLTYAELIRGADQIARHLLASRVAPTDLVGVCLDRGSSLVAALLGVLRAGCGYLPLDPEYPPDRLGFMLRDSGATAVIGTSEHLARVPAGGARLIDIADARARAGASEAELPVVSARDLAYVIYTSGSTGVPKGVAVEHEQVARLFDAVQQRIPVSETDVWSWFHSVAFDFSVWEIWGALTSGGRLVVVSRADARDPAAFLSVVRRSGTTILSQTPSAFHGLLATLDREHQDWSVRAVVLGGEAVSVTALASVFQDPPGGRPRLYNLYGITETTVHATVKELTSHDLHAGVRSPIGTPLEDLRLAVMDPERRQLPPGEQGELWVGGAGVARGYIGRPELTADRFVTGLLPEYGRMRWYRSGDLARKLPSGEFEYIGRIDRQVKLRGFRIELGEVEAVLAGHPAVAAAAVEFRAERLIAYLVHARQAAPNLGGIRGWLASRLPGYMIPSSFISIDALPLTANGKIDRDALGRVPGVPLPRPAAAHDPRTEAESALQAIWSHVLDTTAIGRDDSFFAIGGDSMLALRVVAEGKEAGIRLTVRDLFAHPTLASLARVVGALPAGAGRNGAGREQTAPAPDADVLIPASQMQRGMLFESARDPDAYHVVSAIRVTSSRDFSEGDVRAALLRLAVDNAALRMSFDLLRHRRPMQIVHGAPELCLDYLDVSGLGPREQEQRISDVFAREHARHFTEHDFPLWRLACVQVSPRSAEVMLAHHHAILDGWSVARFFDQFGAALSGQPYQAAPVSINEAAAHLEEEAIASPDDVAFWRSQAQAWRPLPLSRRARQANGFVSARAHADTPLREAIRDTAARWQCSPKHVYLAAHLRAIADFAGWDDYAATGVVVNGRPELPQAHDALGMFLNVVPLVVTGLGSNWADLARAAAEAETRMQLHRWFPQATMVTNFGIPPLNVCFNYTDFSATAMRGFLSSVTETSPNGMPLTVSVVDDGLVAEVATQYLSIDECARLVRCHQENLRDAIRG
jgi:amino acid adenylation domain-containing protein